MKKFIFIAVLLAISSDVVSQTRYHEELKYAIRLYRNNLYNQSLQTLTELLKNPKVDKKEFKEAYLYLAFNHLKLNKQYLAEPALEELLKHDPYYEPDLSKFGSEEVEFFQEFGEFSFGSLKIITSPDSAEVYIDESYYGSTPLIIEKIFADDYEVTIIKGGYKVEQFPVSIFPGDTMGVTQRLKYDDFAAVTKIITRPPGAEVWIDDTFKGYSPLFLDDIISGNYSLKIEKDKYKDIVFSRNLRAHELNNINVDLLKEKDYFVYSMIVPGLTQFVKGYRNHGFLCVGAFAGFFYYTVKSLPEEPEKYMDRLSSVGGTGRRMMYYINDERVSWSEYNHEFEKKQENEKLWDAYSRKKWKYIVAGTTLYALNLLDAYLVLRHDDKKREREQLRELGFEWDRDKVMVSMRFHF